MSMKKIITFLFFLAISTLSTWAQSWCGDSYMVVNSSTWYTGSNSYLQAGGKFQGANLGTFATNFTIGAELYCWPSTPSATTTLNYSIDSGTSVAIPISYFKEAGSNSEFQSVSGGTVNISSLSNGSHSIAVWFKVNTIYDNNANANFTASFTKSTNTDVSNQLESAFIVSTLPGHIKAQFEGNATIELFTISGQLIDHKTAVNEYTQAVKTGAYLLRINGKTQKILVN